MELIVLGNYGPYPGPNGEAVTGFLISSGKTNIVLDLGNGSMCNYVKHRSWDSLDAVVLSHLHDDHTGDLTVLRYVKRYESSFHGRIFLPKEPAFANIEPLSYEFYGENSQITVGDMQLTFCLVVHPVPTYAVRIESEGKVFVYSADSAFTEKLISFSSNADLFLCEAGVLDSQVNRKHIHMSVMEGCRIGREANVKKIVFCHLLTGNPLKNYEDEIVRNQDMDAELGVENKVYKF